jgi:hypothetical protein
MGDKRLAKTYYKRAAERCVHSYSEQHPPLAKKAQGVSYTRSPSNGAWVELWVWVPDTAAFMEKK